MPGEPGYYAIEGDHILIDRWELTNGGQLAKQFGILKENGSLKLYEERVLYCYGSFECLRKQHMFSSWEKQSLPGMQSYWPSW